MSLFPAELSVIVCENTRVKRLLDNLKNYPVLKHLVVWGDPLAEDLTTLAKELEVSVHTVDEMEVSTYMRMYAAYCVLFIVPKWPLFS